MKEDQIKKLAELRASKSERWSIERLIKYAHRHFGIMRDKVAMTKLLDDYDKIAEPKLAPMLEDEYPGGDGPATAFQLHHEVMRRRPVRKNLPSNMRVIDISCAEGRKYIAQRLIADRARKVQMLPVHTPLHAVPDYSGPTELNFDDGRRF